MAGDKRFEHLRTVLETVMLPLHQSPVSGAASRPLGQVTLEPFPLSGEPGKPFVPYL